MKTILFDTMDAENYIKMIAVNAGMPDFFNFRAYPSTKLSVPLPSECPCCHKIMATNIMPVISINNAIKTDDDECLSRPCDVVSVYRCSDCNNLFAIWSKNNTCEETSTCIKKAEYPSSEHITSFSDEICRLSPDFVEIYHQAEQAENYGLKNICGVGYRKSLEFLVDNYIRKTEPELDPKKFLSKKIEEHIADERIKKLALKAAWLGNDQTHIVNKHPDRDVEDIKKFINAMIKIIEADYACDDADTIE